MHFWIDKRSPYGFGRGARVSGSGFGQYPRRLRPSKPWPQSNRNAATTPTSIDRNSYGAHGDGPPVCHGAHGDTLDGQLPPSTSSPSYFKWSLWALAIALSTLLIYIICAKLYHDHQLFTFCALLAIFFILGVCTVSNMFRRTAPPPPAPPPTPPAVPVASQAVVRQESTSSSSRTAVGGQRQHHHHHHHQQQQQQQQLHHHHHHHHHQNHTQYQQQPSDAPGPAICDTVSVPENRSPSISIHNLAESPTPAYHSSNNQYSPPPYHIALEMHFPNYAKNCDELSLPPYDKIDKVHSQA